MSDRTDEQLIDSARKGDDKAFEELVRRHGGRVAVTAIGMLGDCPEAEDVGQETFIRFYRALGSFRGESHVATYLTRIAINLSLNELKRRKRRSSLFRRTEPDPLDDIPDERSLTPPFLDQKALHQALLELEPEYRAVVVLRAMNGFSTGETADLLKIPVGTVFSRLARAQKKLRKILEPDFGG